MLKHNLIANWIGQVWTILMNFAFLPLYIKYLGIEAYGLIGFFVLLQTWLSILDMGISPTLTREMARFTGSENNTKAIRKLLRSAEIFILTAALALVAFVILSADWLAQSWVNFEKISNDEVKSAISLLGLVMGIRFLETVYTSSIMGLQRQVVLNVVRVTFATLRGLGAVTILAYVAPTIHAYFLWQALISFVFVLVLGVVTYGFLPNDGNRGTFPGVL